MPIITIHPRKMKVSYFLLAVKFLDICMFSFIEIMKMIYSQNSNPTSSSLSSRAFCSTVLQVLWNYEYAI